MGVVFTAIYLVSVPAAGIRLLLAYNFPDKVDLNSWQQVSARALNLPKSNAHKISGAGLVQSGKQYRYIKNNQQLELQMLYVVNTKGELDPLLIQPTEIEVKSSKQNIRKRDGIGYYELKTDGNLAYLNACINPRGGSTVTSAQFNHNRFKYDFTWSRILPWVLGKEVLKDNRCIWAQLSTPLHGATSYDAYQTLESVWADNYTTWQSRFPAL